MKKLEVNTIKFFLREPVVEFNRPDGGRSIKTISLLDDEEKKLVYDTLQNTLAASLEGVRGKIIKKVKTDKTITEKINITIEQSGLSDYEIAVMSGLSERAIYNLRKGRQKNPTYKTLVGLANALQCDVVDLI